MFIIFNHEKLEQRINEVFGSLGVFGVKMGFGKQTIYSRLIGETEFKADEITKAAELLDIAPVEIPTYFFDVEYCGA